MVYRDPKDIPIEQYRGIQTVDRTIYLLLARATIESVAQAFCQTRQATVWERDVYGRSVEIVGQSFVVFQFRGHPWTLVQELSFLPGRIPVPLSNLDAEALSRQLHASAMYFKSSDTSGTIKYYFYNNGALAEMLAFEEGFGCQFESQLRQPTPKEIKNASNLTYTFIQAQDIYIPSLYWSRVIVGQRVALKVEGHIPDYLNPVTFDRSHFERVDYIAIT